MNEYQVTSVNDL